jgi:chromosome segregation ATPase
MRDDRKELIWVSKELADEYKQLESVEEQERAVKKIIESKRLDLEEEQELLSENVLLFKGVCLAHKKELSKVYQEQADLLNTLWEDMGDVSTQISQHVNQMTKQIAPLKREVADLKKELDGLRLYVPERLARLAEQVSSMDEKTKSLLRELLVIDSRNANNT